MESGKRATFVKSAKFLFSFNISEIGTLLVNVLSVFQNNLLIGTNTQQLLIYGIRGDYKSTITLTDNAQDAAWIVNGNIICVTNVISKVLVLSNTGDIVTETQMSRPLNVYVSPDYSIYVRDTNGHIYQSKNNGFSWTLVFILPRETLKRSQLIQMSTTFDSELWLLETTSGEQRAVFRIFSMGKNYNSNNMTERYVNITAIPASINAFSSLIVDNVANIFLSSMPENKVLVLTLKGECRALISDHLKYPTKLALDNYFLYVGQATGVVSVFELVYMTEYY